MYDYENRIYRVDITATSNLYALDKDVKLGFIMDVSASMKFPSQLDMVSRYNNTQITINEADQLSLELYRINQSGNKTWLDQSKTYYIISDKSGTATVDRIFYDNGNWYYSDASKNDKKVIETNTKFHNNDSTGMTYPIYMAGDPVIAADLASPEGDLLRSLGLGVGNPRPRAFYLQRSLRNTITELQQIMDKISVASNPNQASEVLVAWNTFCGSVNNSDHTFRSPANVSFRYSYDGGTSTDAALKDAKDFGWGSDGNTSRFAILITDGAPQKSGNPISNETVGEAASGLKNRGTSTTTDDITLVTLGLSMGDVRRGEILLYDIASRDQENVPYYYEAESGNELELALAEVIRLAMVNAIVEGNVTDTVNEAFYPVDKESGLPLENGNVINLNGEWIASSERDLTAQQRSAGYGVISESDGTYTVTWTGQEFTWAGWHGTIYEKAKEDFLGGNAVRTNDPDHPAVVTSTGYKLHPGDTTIEFKDTIKTAGTKSLETPRVNVNELKFTENSTEWTVYLGTSVNPLDQIKALYNKIKINQVITNGTDTDNDGFKDTELFDGEIYPLYYDLIESASDARENETYGEQEFFYLSDLIKKLNGGNDIDWDQLIELSNESGDQNTGITFPYDLYGQDNPGWITIKLEKNHSVDPHVTDVVGAPVETYTLTTLFSPLYDHTPVGQGGDGMYPYHTGKYGLGTYGNAAGTEEKLNEHKINVYAKTIEVEKRKPASGTETALLTDKPATFSIYRKWKESDGEENKVSLAGYVLNDLPIPDDDFYFLVESKQTENGVAKFTVGLSSIDTPYYLAETEEPEGYAQSKVIKTITVTPGPETKTDLGGASTTNMPYNWIQGVRFYFDNSVTPAVYVNEDGEQIVPTTGDGARDYVLPTDTDGHFRTSILNTPLGYLRVYKEVKYNGQTPSTDAQKKVLAGEYIFKVYTNQNCTLPVMNGESEVELTVEIEEDGVAQYSNTVSLPVGKYWLKEIISDDAYVFPVGKNPQEIEITENNTINAPKKVEVTNDYEFNEDEDKIAVDIVKQFTGLTSNGQIPAGYKAVLSYTYDGNQYVVDLGNSSYITQADNSVTPRVPGGVQVKISKSDDGLKWSWHVYNIPKESTGFKIHEENYDKIGYDLEVFIDGTKVTNPEEDKSLNVAAPEAHLQEITDTGRITPESTLRSFYVGNDYILVVSIVPNSNGVVIISERSLNYLERQAIEYVVENWNGQGPFCGPVRFYSTEQHNATINVGKNRDITVKTDAQGRTIIELPPKTNNQVLAFDVTYNNLPAYNNCTIENKYTETGIDLDIVKVDAEDMETPLAGAQFTLTKLDPNGRGSYLSGNDAVEKTSSDTDAEGKTTITNITSGYYEISETKSPPGYVIVDEGKFYIWVNDGVIKHIIKTENDPETPEDESFVKSWTVVEDNSDGTLRFTSAQAAIQDNPETTEVSEEQAATNATFIVGNTPGTELPHTGGNGVETYRIIGMMLMLFAGLGMLLVGKKSY